MTPERLHPNDRPGFGGIVGTVLPEGHNLSKEVINLLMNLLARPDFEVGVMPTSSVLRALRRDLARKLGLENARSRSDDPSTRSG